MSSPQYQGYAPAPAAAKTNGLAIAALVSSFFISLLGIILGHIALNQIKTTGEGGRGLAIAALVIGYVSIAFAVILIVVVMGSAAANR
jgi:peptidyl-prolyl cis-trans isomerase B (cyclophilin B)